jgi:hypothetical protein
MTTTVNSPWKGSGTPTDPYRPQLNDDYPGLTWTDSSGYTAAQIAAGGAIGNLLVTGPAATLAAIQANPTYQQATTVSGGTSGTQTPS